MEDVELRDNEVDLWLKIQSYKPTLGDSEENRKFLGFQRKLTRSLLKRGAVPAQRLAYFLVPEYRTGHGNGSWKEIFESNGTEGEEIFEHPHFTPFLNYFVGGASVPIRLKHEARLLYSKTIFKQDFPAALYSHISKNKYFPLDKDHFSDFAEEVYKLLIDFNVPVYYAKSIRSKVMSRK